jgi:HK97 family phage portal protein
MSNVLARWFRKPAAEERTIYQAGWTLAPGAARINAIAAENLSTVAACVSAISSALASMPARVYRSLPDGGRAEAPAHPVSRLIQSPNAWQTWPDFVEWLMGQVLLQGNALAAIDVDGAGRPVALTPIPWNFVSPQILPSGRLAFDVVAYASPYGGAGLPRRLFADECLFLKDRSDDGWIGRSRISRAPAVLAAASGLQTYSTAVWDNAATPSGVMTLPANIKPDGIKRIEAWFNERFAGAHNGKRVLFADSGSSFTPVSVSPEDAEVLASRRFSGEEIARLFNVPPPIIGDLSHGTFTNSETAGRWFAMNTLTPWARKIEAEFARVLFNGPGVHIEIDLSGLMRGDFAARWAANVAAVNAGILTPNEIREAEGFNPIEGGDVLRGAVASAAPADPDADGDTDKPGGPDPDGDA